MSPPPRRIRASQAPAGDGAAAAKNALSSKYPQTRRADPAKRLFDTNEEQILNDLDETTENEKLRKQIFKLNRRLLTLEKQSKEDREFSRLVGIFLGIGLVASMAFSITRI